ncbi:MAG: MlaD family protein [Kofleriaceae bacterium]
MLAQDDRLTRRVGAITIVVLLAAIVFFVFIAGHLELGKRVRMAAYFRGTGGLREGAPVIVAGREIGAIESIQRSPHGAPGPLDGEEGVVAMIVLDADMADRIARGGDVFIAGRGAFAARHLEIGPSPNPDAAPIYDGYAVRGIDPPTLDRVLQRTWDNLTTAKQFVDDIAPEFDQLRAQLVTLSATIDNLVPPNMVGAASLAIEVRGMLDELRTLRETALGGDVGLAKISAVLERGRATIAQVRRTLDLLAERATLLAASVDKVRARLGERGPAAIAQVELAIARVRAAMAKIDPLLAKLADINARIARGEGSIGKLATDPEFPEDAKDLGKIMKREPWKIFARPPN